MGKVSRWKVSNGDLAPKHQTKLGLLEGIWLTGSRRPEVIVGDDLRHMVAAADLSAIRK